MPAVTEFSINTAGPVFAGTLFPFLFITDLRALPACTHGRFRHHSEDDPEGVPGPDVGYGGMLMESFVAAMALAAAVSLNQGVYFGMNMSRPPSTAWPAHGGRHGRRHPQRGRRGRRDRHRKMGVTDTKGQQITAVGIRTTPMATVTYRGADAYMKVAEDVGEPSIVSRTGGAPTLAVGLANILRNLGGGPGMMGFWYHFAIMFEALFILSAVDAVTRVARFQLSDALGNLIPKFKDPSWLPGSLVSTAVVVSAWGSVLLMGVTDPRGGIHPVPLFGIANQ